MCPVCALKCHVGTTAQFRRSDQLFVYYGGVKKCVPVSKQRLSNWIVETNILAYKAAGGALPLSLTCYFTRASHRLGLLLEESPWATWVSPSTFVRFIRL